jgi:D-alanyl-D-alanine carboxypeptidase
MTEWPHDDQLSLTRFYGRPGQVAMENVVVPWHMIYAEPPHPPIPHFLMHVKCVPAMHRIFTAIWDYYGQSQQMIEEIGMHIYGGAYNPRKIRGSRRWSVHAFGAAVDFDPEHNAMNYLPHNPHKMAQPVIDAFKAEGAFWGGDFSYRHDPMHFQFAHEGLVRPRRQPQVA